MTPRDNTDD